MWVCIWKCMWLGGVAVIWHYCDWGCTVYVARVLDWVWLWVDHGDTGGWMVIALSTVAWCKLMARG